METEDKRLTIPTNIPLRWELFRGFGKSELIKTLIVAVCAIAVDVAVCILSTAQWKLIFCVIFTLFTIAIAVLSFEKMDNNLSAYEYIKAQIDFSREQQKFIYKSKKEKLYVNK